MAAGVVPSANSSILEVLNLYNYEDWSLRVETYLIAEGLWDVVEATAGTPNNGETECREWRMKNAKALHSIQNSCRADVFGFIRGTRSAKDAWETLAKRLKPKNRDIEGMAATLVPSAMINLKPLNKDNYKHWSFWVRKYLLAEDLWDVVQGTSEHPKPEDGEGEAEYMAWRKNNERALHVITIFSGQDAQSCISDSEMAKDAWKTLAEKFNPPQILETPEEDSEVDLKDDIDSNDGDADLEIVEVQATNYEPFFKNVRNREWEAAKEFINQHPEAVRAKDQLFGCTALQQAVFWERVDSVKELLPLMKNKDLDILSDVGYLMNTRETALSTAIENSDTEDAVEIVKCIVEKNRKLLLRVVHPSANVVPLMYALSLDKPKMAHYLYSVTPFRKPKSRDAADAAELVSMGLRLKYLDISLDLLRRFPKLAIAKDHSGETPLNELASTRAGLFLDASQLGIWKRLIYICTAQIPPFTRIHRGDVSINISEKEKITRKNLIGQVICFFRRLVVNLSRLSGIDSVYQMKLLHVRTTEILDQMCKALKLENCNYMQRKFAEKALFQAVERGHVLFVRTLIQLNKSWCLAITNEHDKTLLQFAAEHRQEEIFDMIHYWCAAKERKEILSRKDKFGNNMLHVVGKLSPLTQIAHIRGAALQMQYELQWFKKVERMASHKDLNCINSDGLTPREVFTINHRNLVEAGEMSMKETATSSSALVAALIITVMFAAVVTVPGGIHGETGIPIYLNTDAFKIFIIADVISLCSSTTSVMVFLGILTSRFAEEDFLTSLPTKLIIGFLSLFLSIGSMMVAFASAVFIMLPGKPSIVIPSIALAGVPIASFLWMQFPFLLEVIISTYGLSFRPMYLRLKRWARRLMYRAVTLKQWARRLKRWARRRF